MSADLVCTADYARSLTDRIKVAVEGTWHLIVEAYQSRAWSALGYSSWDDYCTREFGTARLRLPREERQEVVSSLRECGLSLRAIESATGESVTTVRRELARVPNGTPEPVAQGRLDCWQLPGAEVNAGPTDAALDAAAQAYVDAVARRDAKTPHQAALDAWTPGGPSVADIEAQIRAARGLPLRDTA